MLNVKKKQTVYSRKCKWIIKEEKKKEEDSQDDFSTDFFYILQ